MPNRRAMLANLAQRNVQRYEFLAVDGLVDRADCAALRKVARRARVTPTSLVAIMEYGALNADSLTLMRRHYDLHVFWSAWGTRRLMIKLQKRQLDWRAIEPILDGLTMAGVHSLGGEIIIDIHLDDIEDDKGEDRPGLAELTPLRAALLDGDRRMFDLLWLLGLETGDVDPDETAPMRGIGPLDEGLDAFAVFLQLDPELVEAASEPASSEAALNGAALQERALALRRAREAREAEQALARSQRALAIKRSNVREWARAAAGAEAACGDGAWATVERNIARRSAGGYAKAKALIGELRQRSIESGDMGAFDAALHGLRQRHGANRALMQRLVGLG